MERTEEQIHRLMEQIRKGNPLALRIELLNAQVTVYHDGTDFYHDTPQGKRRIDRSVLVRALRLFIEEQKQGGHPSEKGEA